MMNTSTKTALPVCLWLLGACVVACSGDANSTKDAKDTPADGSDRSSSEPSAAPTTDYKVSARSQVQWKRAAAVEADLMRALDLQDTQLCNELGDKNCIREVHLVPLGGNEPYVSGLMKPSVEPLATSPAVVDRVLLSACSKRADLDARGDAKVFTKLDFDKPLPAADDPAIKDTVTELYRRLLARDPRANEITLVASLAEAPDDEAALSARDFAALACFSIGSSTEFLFF